MSVYGRMPDVTAVERGRQCPGRSHTGIAVQGVADLVGIFFMDTRECEMCEALGCLMPKSGGVSPATAPAESRTRITAMIGFIG